MPNQQIVRVSTGFLDTVNDALPGMPVSSGTGQSSWSGMVGAEIEISNRDAAKQGKNNTLYGGKYKYVQFKSGASTAAARGLLCFYANVTDMQSNTVTNDGGATVNGLVAGIALNAVTAGNYGWIQVDGIANVQFKSSVADTTTGNVVAVDGTSANADSLADATGTLTYALVKKIIGVSVEATTNSTISRVLLRLPTNFA